MKQLGEKIKIARKKKQITQEHLARAVGVSDKSVSAYESGRVQPPLEVLEKIARSTQLPISYFVDTSANTTIIEKLNEVQQIFEEIKLLLKSK